MEKLPFEFFKNEVSQEEIDKINEFIENNKIGVDQLKLPGPILNEEQLLELMKNISKLEEIENIAEKDSKDNPFRLMHDLELYIKMLKKDDIKLKILINESRDNGDLSLMIGYMIKKQEAINLIKDLQRKIDEIKNEN